MSKVYDADECSCSCHTYLGAIHCVPCCDGQCHVCKRYISRGKLEGHYADKHDWLDDPKNSLTSLLWGGD